ncbi:MAG: hypothetical protein WCB57_07785 [Pseudonocardiaceae bacterium]
MAHHTGVARRQTAGGTPRAPEVNSIQSRLSWLSREELEALARRTRRPYAIVGLASSCRLAGSAPDFADRDGPDVERIGQITLGPVISVLTARGQR